MKYFKKIFLFVLLLSFFELRSENQKPAIQADQSKFEYYLCVCGFFRDEAPYLEEWIEFHLLMGVEHFYLYNNNSSDNYLEVLGPYISEGIVTLIDWPSQDVEGNYLQDQQDAYNACIKSCQKICQWLAIIDIDEFIIPVEKSNIIEFLSDYDQQPRVGGIKINWQLYGTSGLFELPKEKLMVESLVMKAPWNYSTINKPHNGIIKSIIRPETVVSYTIHYGIFKKSYYSVPLAGNRQFQPVIIDKIRINHYWTRTEKFFYDVKIARRLRFCEPSYYDIMLKKLGELSVVEDRIMDRFIPALKERMKKRS